METGKSRTGLAVGVVGLGNMGTPIARHLLQAHPTVYVNSLRRVSELENEGAQWLDDLATMGERADAILFMVPDLPQVYESLERECGLLSGIQKRSENKEPLLIMIGSTASAVGVRKLDAELRELHPGKAVLVDTPVSGGVDGALAGTLSVMVGGDDEAALRAIEVLSPVGTPVHLGPLGAGQVAKACNQLVVGATMFALGEATVLAERSGLDTQVMWDLLSGGYSGSRLLETRKEALVKHDDSPSGPIKFLQKDVKIGLEVAAATDTKAVMLPALERFLGELVGSYGLGDRDLATTRRFIEERSRS